jgi:hypothetical protein
LPSLAAVSALEPVASSLVVVCAGRRLAFPLPRVVEVFRMVAPAEAVDRPPA